MRKITTIALILMFDMIILMPYITTRPKPMPYFTKDVNNDIISFVKKNHPVLSDSESLAIAESSVDGGHTWMNCKFHLSNTLQKLFKQFQACCFIIVSEF